MQLLPAEVIKVVVNENEFVSPSHLFYVYPNNLPLFQLRFLQTLSDSCCDLLSFTFKQFHCGKPKTFVGFLF